MSGPAPRVTIAKPSRANGSLSVAGAPLSRSSRNQPEGNSTRSSAARLKVVIRRLPPGLLQTELEETLGDEWKVGGSKVNWGAFRSGKVSKDPAKPSKPGRVYLHLKRVEDITQLSQKVQAATFNDAKNTSRDSALLGPPILEFAPYGRVPNPKPRKDARQGTIDQDPEFIDFLESLTNPISKAQTVDQDGDSLKGKEKVTTTPLVEFLKEKKANKAKETSSKGAKHSRQDSKEGKAASNTSSKKIAALASPAPSKKRGAQGVKGEQTAKEVAAKDNEPTASARTAAVLSTPGTAAKSQNPKSAATTTINNPLSEKKRERGNAATAVKMLQRDLLSGAGVSNRGLRAGGRGGHTQPPTSQTKAATKNAKADEPKATTSAEDSAAHVAIDKSNDVEAPTIIPKSAAPTNTPKGSAKSATASTATSAKPSQPSPTATQAFLKHANASGGVTEELIEEAFGKFGTVKKVEIDHGKGLAYVDFETPEALQRAIKASPIKVAKNNLPVSERKIFHGQQPRNSRGGAPTAGRGGRASESRGTTYRGRGNTNRGGVNAASGKHKSKAATENSVTQDAAKSGPADVTKARQLPSTNASSNTSGDAT